MKKKILIVDDNDDILYTLKYTLEKNDYLVSTANDGEKGLSKALSKKYDLIILDMMMPKMEGDEVCKKIRENENTKDTLIIFLTAKSDNTSVIEGLELADDYITKPIKMDFFTKKIKSVLRRQNREIETEESIAEIEIDKEFSLDLNNISLIENGKEIHLTRKEYDILRLFLSDKNNIFSREDIFKEVWGDSFVMDGTLDVHIKKLRDKLSNKYIKTKKGIGYKFIKND